MYRTTTVIALGTLLLAGCSERRRDDGRNKFAFQEAREPERVTTVDIKEEASRWNAPTAPVMVAPPAMVRSDGMTAPGISVAAAPGVAFNYRYAFVLPDTAISAIQEQHATACEKLGPTRCRITGMHYTLVDEDQVRGQLQFKLDPALARQFGKDGIAAVERAKGRLVDAAIEGTDMASAITESQRRSLQFGAELSRIERQLANGQLSREERAELLRQAERLRMQQAREQDTRSQGEEMLANTPMTFNYAGNKGFGWGDDAIGDAWVSSQSSFTTMVSIILILIGSLLPWALLLALLVLVWRRTPLRKLRFRRDRAETEVDPAAPPSPASPEPAP